MVQVLIAGGGIGGLSTALACARSGARVSLFERSSVFSKFGAGIQLGPNAVRVLYSWGLQAALQAVAVAPQQAQFRDANSGALLGQLDMGSDMAQRYGAPYLTVHRVDLHQVLLQAAQACAGLDIHLDCAVETVTQSQLHVCAHLSNGTQVSGDVLVAADGVWSKLRQQLLHDGAPQPTGHLAYRAMVRQSDLPAKFQSQQITVWFGPRMHVVQYPVRGGDWMNLVAIVSGQIDGDISNWDHSANAADLQRVIAGSCAPLRDLIHAISAWRLWPLSIRLPMRSAQEQALGRVALLGDAAHPMVPYLAQGAAMAIEDAAALTQLLDAAGVFASTADTAAVLAKLPRLLQDYAQLRWRRNARVQAKALQNGQIYHLSGPLRLGRNLALRWLGQRLLDQPWLYGGGPV